MKGQNQHSVTRRLFRKKRSWKHQAERRRIRHFRALPKAVAAEVSTLREYIKEHDPLAGMKLTGSWAKGTWIDERTSKDFRRTRMMMENKVGPSALHIVVDSRYPFTAAELQGLSGMKVRLWKLPFLSVKGIVLLKGTFERIQKPKT